MDRLRAMELFALAVEEGTLSAGAKRLGRPAVAATRAVNLLEQETGEKLLVRSTRSLGLTAAGEHWLAVWQDVLNRLAAGRATKSFGGTFSLTAPDLFGRTWVQPIVEEFLNDHPDVDVRLLLLARVVDLVEEGVDLGIRVGPLPENGVSATKVGEVHSLLCAAPAYLERYGSPIEPSHLSQHVCIGAGPTAPEFWKMTNSHRIGRTQAHSIWPRLAINNTASVLEAVLRGFGIGLVMSCQAFEHITAGRLRLVLPRRCCELLPVHIVFRGQPPRTGPVRDFVDEIAPILRGRLEVVSSGIQTMMQQL